MAHLYIASRHRCAAATAAEEKQQNESGLASYHLSVQLVKRSEGRSVVAMAAYRAGVALRDDRREAVAAYSRRRGVVHAEILVPEGCAEWLGQRATLWNHVEAIEVRRDAQLAREINIALPHELSEGERLALVRGFAREQFVALGMVVDLAIHAPVAEKGDDPRNFHAHLMLTLRQASPLGLHRVKTREWNSESMLLQWREAWAKHQNEALRSRGHVARVDHRTLELQKQNAMTRGDRRTTLALERSPEIHVGPQVRRVGPGAAPTSRDKAVGPLRKRGGVKQRRRIAYTELDRGSRAAFTATRLRLNAEGFGKAAAKAQLRIARLRKRQAYYVRQIREHEVMRRDHENAWQRTLHARRRAAQVQQLIAELDGLFFLLLGLRENQLSRSTVWSNRARPRVRPETEGRPRQR